MSDLGCWLPGVGRLVIGPLMFDTVGAAQLAWAARLACSGWGCVSDSGGGGFVYY